MKNINTMLDLAEKLRDEMTSALQDALQGFADDPIEFASRVAQNDTSVDKALGEEVVLLCHSAIDMHELVCEFEKVRSRFAEIAASIQVRNNVREQ